MNSITLNNSNTINQNLELNTQNPVELKVQKAALGALSFCTSSISKRMTKNVVYIAIAIILATIGGLISSLASLDSSIDPYTVVVAGAVISAVANMVSTVLAYDTGQIAQLEKKLGSLERTIQNTRALKTKCAIEENNEEAIEKGDIPLKEIKIELESKKDVDIENGLEIVNSKTIAWDLKTGHKVQNLALKVLSVAKEEICIRNLKNLVRVLVAGGFTCAGSLVGLPDLIELFGGVNVAAPVGAALQGFGNVLSTYFAIDDGKNGKIREKIEALKKELNAINLQFELGIELGKKILMKEPKKKALERFIKNMLSMGTAGGLSGLGGLMANLPQVATWIGNVVSSASTATGIADVMGAILEGVGNGGSSRLAYDTGKEELFRKEIDSLERDLMEVLIKLNFRLTSATAPKAIAA